MLRLFKKAALNGERRTGALVQGLRHTLDTELDADVDLAVLPTDRGMGFCESLVAAMRDDVELGVSAGRPVAGVGAVSPPQSLAEAS